MLNNIEMAMKTNIVEWEMCSMWIWANNAYEKWKQNLMYMNWLLIH